MEQLFSSLKTEQQKILSYVLSKEVDKNIGLGLPCISP